MIPNPIPETKFLTPLLFLWDYSEMKPFILEFYFGKDKWHLKLKIVLLNPSEKIIRLLYNHANTRKEIFWHWIYTFNMTKLCVATRKMFSKKTLKFAKISSNEPKYQNTSTMIALHLRIDTEPRLLLKISFKVFDSWRLLQFESAKSCSRQNVLNVPNLHEKLSGPTISGDKSGALQLSHYQTAGRHLYNRISANIVLDEFKS